MPILSIRHLTRYRYRKAVAFGEHRMMFRPLESYDQRLLSWTVEITPEPEAMRHVHDVFGNCVGIATFDRTSDELVFDSRVTLDHRPQPGLLEDGESVAWSETLPLVYGAEDLPDLMRSIERHHPDPGGAVEAWARRFLRRGGPTRLADLLARMTQAIHSDFRYATRLYGEPQAPARTLELKAGTCRDFAMLMMEAARSLGLAAQFVSGYIYSPARAQGGLTRVGAGHTHAWLRVYLPACGWVEFDPTNGIIGNRDLVRVAIARDPRQAVPLGGRWIGAASDYVGMDVEVDVRCEDEATTQTTAPPAAPSKSRRAAARASGTAVRAR